MIELCQHKPTTFLSCLVLLIPFLNFETFTFHMRDLNTDFFQINSEIQTLVVCWVMVSNIFLSSPAFGEDEPILTSIFF